MDSIMNEDKISEVHSIISENKDIQKLIEVETDYYLDETESSLLADKIADLVYDELMRRYVEIA